MNSLSLFYGGELNGESACLVPEGCKKGVYKHLRPQCTTDREGGRRAETKHAEDAKLAVGFYLFVGTFQRPDKINFLDFSALVMYFEMQAYQRGKF